MIEKTLGSFPNDVLSEQYRQLSFKTYAELATHMQTAEERRRLVRQTTESRPAGAPLPPPEVHAVDFKSITEDVITNKEIMVIDAIEKTMM